MKLSYDRIKYLVFAYIGLSAAIFLIFYLRLWIAGSLYTGLMIAFFIRQRVKMTANGNSKSITVSKLNLIIYAAVSLLWTFLGGMGGHFFQASDWAYRNAIFRDLITRPWPVVYPERGRMLVYYIGHWMPSASLTKLLSKITSLSEEALWVTGNQLLWLYTALGVFIVMLLLLCIVKTESPRRQLILPVFLIGFSGMDILGALLDHFVYHEVNINPFHIEWWSGFLQYSSTTTCLFWVFNQTVIPWIVILCLCLEETPRSYVFLGLCAALAGPIPFMCIFVYMTVLGIKRIKVLMREKDGRFVRIIKELFDPVNLLSVIPLLIVIRFYSTNAAINMSDNSVNDVAFSFLWFKINAVSDGVILRHILLFLVFEAVIYLLLLFTVNRHNCMYWTTFVLLTIAPFVSMGNQGDFVMRFSVPAVMVMLAMCAKALLSDDAEDHPSNLIKGILIVCLLIGSVTPAVEFARGIYAAIYTGKMNNTADNIITLDNDEDNYNFMAYDYANDSFLKIYQRDGSHGTG